MKESDSNAEPWPIHAGRAPETRAGGELEAFYLVSTRYAPELERGLRFDDPWIGIRWPIQPVEMSAKDRAWPRFNPVAPAVQRLRGRCGRVGGTTGGQSCAS